MKYNSKKVLSFVATAGVGSTTLGIIYWSSYPDHFLMSQFSLLLVPFSCLRFLVWSMRWSHTASHVSKILHCRSSRWRNVVGYGCVLLLLSEWRVLIVGNCFALGLRGTTTTSLSASGNYKNESLLIALILLSKKTQSQRQITHLILMTLIMKTLCIRVGDSTIPVFLLAIQISAQHQISWLLLLLAIRLRRNLNKRNGDII